MRSGINRVMSNLPPLSPDGKWVKRPMIGCIGASLPCASFQQICSDFFDARTTAVLSEYVTSGYRLEIRSRPQSTLRLAKCPCTNRTGPSLYTMAAYILSQVYCGHQLDQRRLDSLRSSVPSLDVFGTTPRSQSYTCNATQARLDSLQSPVPPPDVFGTTSSPQSYMCNATDLIAQSTPHKSLSEPDDLPKIGSFTQHKCFENIFEGEEEHCLYVDTDFSDGRGMSILTRPSILKEDISELPIFKSKAFVVTQAERESVAYNVTPIVAKGNGALATRQILKGELINSDHAAAVIIMEFAAFRRRDFDDICVSAFDLLPAPTESSLRKLHGVGHNKTDRVRTAIQRNAFGSHRGREEVLHYAVVPEPSVFNHECRPNSAFYFDDKTLRVYAHAVRDIALGEEITIAYRAMKASRAGRQAAIAHYGFSCTCSHCSMSDEESRASDQRIEEIDAILAHLDDYTYKSKANLDTADRLIQLYHEERLDGLMAEAYTLATMTYNSFGEIEGVKKHAALARSAGILVAGPEWSELPAIEEFLEHPQTHWTYNTRQGMRSRQKSNQLEEP
ncbi:uncharacterized protein MELLADRAFT_110239 [Melampsora larici-populina 98AG31]|uniref:SET domain-containing protein n=1 Tax=Melampsora larici-populina (strain 98AG31 / pathotype 3-4-7) TaxID=747676 RepID=F4RZ46_MELLP|nr:uncharacterized protein MELLADRAFT_110239 [Melampsora larici-populina 98AG31]EGG02382.1 hypothetical protein MELLADRAFT_110239 [Melampsora larici-populina 98AG31]